MLQTVFCLFLFLGGAVPRLSPIQIKSSSNLRRDRASRRIRERAGLPEDFRPLHSLRHVYASMLASSGKVDMYTLKKLMTHKSPLMTQRYTHLRDEALKRASDLAGDIIDKAATSSSYLLSIKLVNSL